MSTDIDLPFDLEIIAYHGWGFDSSFWRGWEEVLPRSVQFKVADKGYFWEEKRPRFSPNDSKKVLFTHSFGLHWCPDQCFEEAHWIVIFNGFRHFPKTSRGEKLINTEVCEKWLGDFDKAPEDTLKRYWQDVFSPEESSQTPGLQFDKELLLSDLENFTSSVFDTSLLAKGKPIMSLDGSKDTVLKKPRGKTFNEYSKGNAVYHIIKEAGHALPVTHAKDCWSFIHAMIPIFHHNEQQKKGKH